MADAKLADRFVEKVTKKKQNHLFSFSTAKTTTANRRFETDDHNSKQRAHNNWQKQGFEQADTLGGMLAGCMRLL